MTKYKQGYFLPQHPEKYVGDITKIRFMSSWELETHKFLDNNTRVLRWSSETIAIPYIKPTDGRIHKYYPDYWVEYINRDGEILQELLECKPKSQTTRPRKQRSTGQVSLYESVQYAINQAKWTAAIDWCNKHNLGFKIITEKSVFR